MTLPLKANGSRMTATDVILVEVLSERARQDAKWGVSNHTPALWLAILQEEVGEYARAVLNLEFWPNKAAAAAAARKELVQIAAVAVAMIECCDRQGWDRQ